jgi:hypothetical protein
MYGLISLWARRTFSGVRESPENEGDGEERWCLGFGMVRKC